MQSRNSNIAILHELRREHSLHPKLGNALFRSIYIKLIKRRNNSASRLAEQLEEKLSNPNLLDSLLLELLRRALPYNRGIAGFAQYLCDAYAEKESSQTIPASYIEKVLPVLKSLVQAVNARIEQELVLAKRLQNILSVNRSMPTAFNFYSEDATARLKIQRLYAEDMQRYYDKFNEIFSSEMAKEQWLAEGSSAEQDLRKLTYAIAQSVCNANRVSGFLQKWSTILASLEHQAQNN